MIHRDFRGCNMHLIAAGWRGVGAGGVCEREWFSGLPLSRVLAEAQTRRLKHEIRPQMLANIMV